MIDDGGGRFDFGVEQIDGGGEARHETRVGMIQRRRDCRAGDAGDRLLARGVDVGDQHVIGVGEGVGKVVPERLRPAVGVRLPDRPNLPIRVAAARGFQRRADLGG